jgi:hypothetical protein
VISLPSNFAAANDQSERQADVLVAVEDVTLFAEKTTEADWGNNVSEADVDYTSTPPDIGNVELANYPIWTSCIQNDKIYNIEADGTLITSFATSVYDASATAPTGIAYNDLDGTLWVCDSTTDKIYNIEIDGTWISEFAVSAFDAAATLTSGISVGPDGTLWISDGGQSKIYNVETDGTLISSFTAAQAGGVTYASDDSLWYCDPVGKRIYNIELNGTAISDFAATEYEPTSPTPRSVSTDPDGNLWISDTGSDKIYNVETDGTLISSFAASVFESSFPNIYGISFTPNYYPTGHLTTDNIDIGEVPTVIGEWAIEDIKPTGTSLTYTAEYSTTGAWGGEEVSIGAIVDGDEITDLKRYWRVTATFTSSTSTAETPILQSIKADYTTYRRFNRITDLGYEPLVEDISSLTSKVDFFNPASIGQISVSIHMSDAVSDWVFGDTLYNKIVHVKLGFKYPGFVEADYIDYFTGAIDDWNVDDQTLNLTLKDLSKEWKLPVPSKWESVADDVTWTAQHHTDIMLDIFQNYINVRDSGLLLDSFATVKAATPAYVVTRKITGNTEDAKKLVEELRVLLSAFFLPRGDGKIGIKQFDSAEAAATTFTDDNTLSIKWQANSKDLINRTNLYFNWDTLGDKEENFDSYDEGNDTASQTAFQEIRPYILKDKWTLTAQASQISALETKILAQFDNMPSAVTITCDARDIAYEAGDMVNVTTLEAPGSGGAGITDEKYLITSKNLDFLGDRIIFKGLKVA